MSQPITKEITLSLLPEQASDSSFVLKYLNRINALEGSEVKSFKIIRRSIDARKREIKINLGLLISNQERIDINISKKNYSPVSKDTKQIVIVGAGPAGLFAGLRAIEKGLKPIIVERGKDVETRRKDIAAISRTGNIDSDSNYCYGEGGAGAFSDGKLFTRSKKRGNVKEVLEILHQFGASEDILVNSHPHIGSDKLPGIIKNIRETIKACGGEVRFGCKMEEIVIDCDRAKGIKTSNGDFLEGPVFLATGHSSRETYKMLASKNVPMEAKGLAIGVRLEHPQKLIDTIQYHSKEGKGKYLPAAEYSFVDQVDGRGVYTFCMCPGGVIVPAANQNGQLVVNGMSASARSGKWANSGYVVELHPGDIPGFKKYGELEMLALQEFLETKFSEESQGSQNAPSQRIIDFIKDKESKDLPATSYAPGIHPADFSKLFPKEISEKLKQGLVKIGLRNPDFLNKDGIMLGLESRTSSPVRIPRDKDDLSHVKIKDLYPVGEGAGYAGGIVSSAIDGMRCVDAFYENINC